MGDKVDRPLLLVGQPLLAPLLPLLASDHDVIALWEEPDATQLARVDAVIWAGEFALDRSLIDAMPRLSLIACFTVGYDGVDLALAKRAALRSPMRATPMRRMWRTMRSG